MLNGANGALLGEEIIQWTTATLIGTKRYRLSGLLRGRLGTEHAMHHHAVGERFIVLRPVGTTLERLRDPVDLINAARWYKAVTVGALITDVEAVAFANGAQGLKPYAPCHLRGQRGNDGALTITWIRRVRFGGLWRDGGDVPLGETEERYDIEVLHADGDVVRTVTVPAPTWTYPAADQIADFGFTPATITVRVFQVSAVVGRGTPLKDLSDAFQRHQFRASAAQPSDDVQDNFGPASRVSGSDGGCVVTSPSAAVTSKDPSDADTPVVAPLHRPVTGAEGSHPR